MSPPAAPSPPLWRAPLGAALRRLAPWVLGLVAYLGARAAFEALTRQGRGLLMAAELPGLGLALLGLLVLGLRLVVLFVLPALSAYLLICRLATAVRPGAAGRTRSP